MTIRDFINRRVKRPPQFENEIDPKLFIEQPKTGERSFDIRKDWGELQLPSDTPDAVRRLVAERTQQVQFLHALGPWGRDVTDALNQLPPYSVFSFGNPNSNLSAIPGTLGFNITSQATSKAWIKQYGSGNTGWASLLTSTVREALTVSAGIALTGNLTANNSDTQVLVGSATGRRGTNIKIGMEGAEPGWYLYETDEAANGKLWDWYSAGGVLTCRIINDADTVATNWLTVTRTGTTVSAVAFPNGPVTVSGLLTASAGAIFGAPARLKGYTVATLPAGTQGDTAFVTDALAPAFLTALVGGGAVVTPAFFDGAAWVAI